MNTLQFYHAGVDDLPRERNAGLDGRLGGWMQTYTGRAYYPADPRVDDVCIDDIAHALANTCRFGGHTSRFYSVAEHSVHVSRCVPPRFALQGLLHDAAEAYVVDVPSPLKHMLTNYAEFEARSWRAVALRFGLPKELDASVKAADNAVLLAERDALLLTPPIPWTWAAGLKPADVDIVGYPPPHAKWLFLTRFNELSWGGL